MKKFLFTGLSLLSLTCTALQAKDIVVNTQHSTLLLKADEGQPLRMSYYGSRLKGDVSQVYSAYSLWEEAYPGFGGECLRHTALSVKHFDGNMSTELVVTGSREKQEGDATLYTITMKDNHYAFEVEVNYRTHTAHDVIETWTVLTNREKKPIVLQQYASGYLPIRQGNVWIQHAHGSWGAEAEITREALAPGIKVIQNTQGIHNSQGDRPEIMFSLDGAPRENSGRAIGAVLCWNGNYKLLVETRDKKVHHFMAGIDEEHSAYTLKTGESFTTPILAYSYSQEGLGGVSRSFHRWAKQGMVAHGMQDRKILLNSWEGVYMDVRQENLEEMMDGLKMLGGELFVMDDGWFGTKHRRTVDKYGLGDWKTDTVKLPKGVPALVEAAKKRGLEFGIWIEPEMTNTLSELYEQHPDWIVCHPDRKPKTGRGGTQLVLDLSNPKVQDFVFQVVDNLMKENPDLYYFKWDANMDIVNFGSHYLTADRQSHLYVDYQLGLLKTLQRIREKYPDLIMQDCASGGGRVNYGLMPYFDEFWVSDNTDAQQRLFIQWGTSMFFPALAMAQHVSASPNHQTGRVIPLKFRFDVAMTGRLGMEMQPKHLNERELAFAKQAFQTYKEIRPLVQHGDLYRLVNPYDNEGFSSLMYVNGAKTEAVFFAYKFEHYVNKAIPRFYFAGLNPEAVYTLHEINCWDRANGHWEGHKFTGEFLMNEGIELNLEGQYASRVIRLTTE